MFPFLHITKKRQSNLTLPLTRTRLHHSEVPEVPEVAPVSLAAPGAVIWCEQGEHSGEDGQLGGARQQEEAGLAGCQAEAGPGEEREENF